MRSSHSFFKHIGNKIDALTKAYALIGKEIERLQEKAQVSGDVKDNQYIFLVKRLNRAIDTFKTEMQESLAEYYFQADNNMVSPYYINHIKEKLDELKKVYQTLGSKIPDTILKDVLGHNYYFHKNLKKLTAKKLMEYFETNYLLHKKSK